MDYKPSKVMHEIYYMHVSLSKGYFWDSLSDCLR